MELNLTSLEKAIAHLELALSYAKSDLAKTDDNLALLFRSASIQAFEFTYELAYKTLKRYLELTEANPAAIDEMSFQTIIRRGFELGLLKAEITEWKEYRKDRGTTSHAYDENKAQDVFEHIPNFLEEVEYLLFQIQKRKDAFLG
jgi:nucleotidyltransferase substrate binding protein (TIGR01987 family)